MKFPELLGDIEIQAVNYLLSRYTALGIIFEWLSQHVKCFLSPSGILSRGLIRQFGISQRPLHLEFLPRFLPSAALMTGKLRLLDSSTKKQGKEGKGREGEGKGKGKRRERTH